MPAAFLLDAHLDPVLARLLRERGIEAIAMQQWQDGDYLTKSDQEMLAAAERDGLTLLSYDVHSLPALLVRFAETGTPHAGVVLISARTVDPRAIAEIALGIERLVSQMGDFDWRNQVLFLPKP